MKSAVQILSTYKDRIRARFLAVAKRTGLPAGVKIPDDPQEALKLGLALGRKEGYGEGLVDGTTLGLDVGLEAVDAMMSQPVILVPGGHA